MSTTRNEPITDFRHDADEVTDLSPRDRWRASAVRLPLFTVTRGEDVVEYTIPGKPNPGLALEFLRQARTVGVELATSWLIEEAVGREGYTALVAELEDYDGDGQKLLVAFGERIQRVVMGGLDGPKA